MTIARKDGWLTAKVGDELVMMSVEKGLYIGLSEVGVRVWDLLETPRDLDSLISELMTEFDVSPEQCRADVQSFLDELEKRGAVTVTA